MQYADAVDIDKFVVFIGERLIESLNLVLKIAKNESIEQIDELEKITQNLNYQMAGKD